MQQELLGDEGGRPWMGLFPFEENTCATLT